MGAITKVNAGDLSQVVTDRHPLYDKLIDPSGKIVDLLVYLESIGQVVPEESFIVLTRTGFHMVNCPTGAALLTSVSTIQQIAPAKEPPIVFSVIDILNMEVSLGYRF